MKDEDRTPEQRARIERLIRGGERQRPTALVLTKRGIEEVPLDQFAPGEAPPVPHGRIPHGDFRWGRRRIRDNSID